MPDWTHEVRARLSGLSLPAMREREIIDELSQHLDDRWRELVAAGVSDEEATRLTLEDFQPGQVLAAQLSQLQQAQRQPATTPPVPTGHLVGDLWRDLRYGTRTLLKQRGFAVAAALTLALGIGASTSVFSVVHGVLLKPLPFQEPERLVGLWHRAPGVNLDSMNHGPATYFTYRDDQRTFEDIGAWESNEVSITGAGEPEQVEALSVTASTLQLLKVTPLRGRLLHAEDDAPGAPMRVVLTHGYWLGKLGGDEGVLGRQLDVDGAPAEIIGILPPTFRFLGTDPAVVIPMQLDRSTAFGGIEFDFQVLGRLKAGATEAQADADIARMIRGLPPQYKTLELEPHVRPLVDDVTEHIDGILWTLLAAVGVVLLIACGNVANLFLIRAEGRQHELAMRAALGATRGRLARTLLSESVLLGFTGGVLGLACAYVAITYLRRWAPVDLPRVDAIALEAPVLIFTIAVSLLASVLVGAVVVWRFGSPSIGAIREGGRSGSDSPARHHTRNGLVMMQVAMALVLLLVSGLMIRTFLAMTDVAPGFTRPEQVQTFRVAIPSGLTSDAEQVVRIHENIAERLAAVPGVIAVGVSSSITMDGEDNANPLFAEEFPLAEEKLPPLRRFKSVAPEYFETMGNPLVAGRAITWSEIYQRRTVVMISETLAREYWATPTNALGRRVRSNRSGPWHEIIGVVGNERDDGLNRPATAIVYWPLLSDSYQETTLAYAVRSNRVRAPGFVSELQQAVWSVNPNLPLAAVQTLDEIQSRSMAQTSFVMVMLAIAAGSALLLAFVGIYGVIAYAATQRTREVGIRMAVGAQVGDVRRMFLRHGLWLTASGIVVGLCASVLVTRLMSTLLYGVRPMDPVTCVAVSALLAGAALVATYVPARRAASLDPVVALRANS